jgi:hypothetical protein
MRERNALDRSLANYRGHEQELEDRGQEFVLYYFDR